MDNDGKSPSPLLSNVGAGHSDSLIERTTVGARGVPNGLTARPSVTELAQLDVSFGEEGAAGQSLDELEASSPSAGNDDHPLGVLGVEGRLAADAGAGLPQGCGDDLELLAAVLATERAVDHIDGFASKAFGVCHDP